MRALTVLYVLFLAGGLTGCAAHLRVLKMRHEEDGS